MILLKIIALVLFPVLLPLTRIFPKLRLPGFVGSSSRRFEKGDYFGSFKEAMAGLNLMGNLASKMNEQEKNEILEIYWDLLGETALDSAEKLNDVERAVAVSTQLRILAELAPTSELGKTERGPHLLSKLKTIFSASDPEHDSFWNNLT